MNSVVSAISNFRTTVPGVASVLFVAAHWWSTGSISVSDVGTILAGFGLIAASDAKPAA